MWLQALLTREDVAMALARLTPIRIGLDDDSEQRYFWLDSPTSVACVPDKGVRVRTRARLQWDLVGIHLPIAVEDVILLLTPSVTQRANKDVLHLSLQVERLSLPMVPSVLEAAAITRLNAHLARPESALVWSFMDTLDFSFELPQSLQLIEEIRLHARWGAVRVSHEGLSLAVAFGLHVNRSDEEAPVSTVRTRDSNPDAHNVARVSRALE